MLISMGYKTEGMGETTEQTLNKCNNLSPGPS